MVNTGSKVGPPPLVQATIASSINQSRTSVYRPASLTDQDVEPNEIPTIQEQHAYTSDTQAHGCQYSRQCTAKPTQSPDTGWFLTSKASLDIANPSFYFVYSVSSFTIGRSSFKPESLFAWTTEPTCKAQWPCLCTVTTTIKARESMCMSRIVHKLNALNHGLQFGRDMFQLSKDSS
ncbi:7323_t:CDS:2, partial [Acaulospora colombiana]